MDYDDPLIIYFIIYFYTAAPPTPPTYKISTLFWKLLLGYVIKDDVSPIRGVQ